MSSWALGLCTFPKSERRIVDHQSRENGRWWQSCPVWLPTTNWTLETFLPSMTVTRLHCLLLWLSEYLVLCSSSPLKLLERHTLTLLFSIMPATNYRLVFLYHYYWASSFSYAVGGRYASILCGLCMYVCMYVCARHMHHSSSVIILVMCVHSGHVIVLSFSSFHVTIVSAHAWFACGSDGRRGMQNM